MLRYLVLALCLQSSTYMSYAAKQQVQLSDSYLPVAMQVIAHLTDQMAYETTDGPSSATSRPPAKPANKPTTVKPNRPVKKPNRPYTGFKLPARLWMSRLTTPFHTPGLYAPAVPPTHFKTQNQQRFVLLPIDNTAQYTVIGPQETRTEETLLSIHDEEVKPILEPTPDKEHLLPPHVDHEVKMRSGDFDLEELDEESLQYLSPDVQSIIKMAYDKQDDRVVDVWDGVRARPFEPSPSPKLTHTNLRLLLLYDLLSREAKRQRLSDYRGFSPDVMRTLVESSGGGAREQLRITLSNMVDRKDCEHEYANNRAKEIVQELGKDDSKLSAELRYLQPLIYRN